MAKRARTAGMARGAIQRTTALGGDGGGAHGEYTGQGDPNDSVTVITGRPGSDPLTNGNAGGMPTPTANAPSGVDVDKRQTQPDGTEVPVP